MRHCRRCQVVLAQRQTDTGKAAAYRQETTGSSRGEGNVGRQAASCELLQDSAQDAVLWFYLVVGF